LPNDERAQSHTPRGDAAAISVRSRRSTQVSGGYRNAECVDELALDYDTIAATAQGMVLDGEISEALRDSAKEILDYLGSFSGEANAHLWTPEALRTAEEWQTIRAMAQKLLNEFH
jgi:hypothetical protein